MSLNTYLKIKTASIKYAGTAGRVLRSLPAHVALGKVAPRAELLALLAEGGGRLAGGSSSSKDIKALLNDNYATDFIPGVAGYKMQKQKRVLENMLRKKKHGNKTMSEILGRHTSAILPYFIGGIAGGRIGKDAFEQADNQNKGFALGAQLAGLANIGGALATNFTKGRTQKDLEDYYNSGIGTTLGNYLIPGMASYNDWKNSVATDRLLDEYKGRMTLPDDDESGPDAKAVPESGDWADFDDI